MHIKHGVACRRDGLIYLQLKVDGIDQGSLITAKASAKDGRHTPAMIFPYQDADWVLCLPAFAIDQHVMLEERNASGDIIAIAEINVGVAETKVRSVLDCKFRWNIAKTIRGYHNYFQTERTRIFFDGGFASESGITLRGSICVPEPDIENASVTLYDTHATIIPNAVKMHNGKSAVMPGTDDDQCTEFPFAITLPLDSQDYVINAEVPHDPGLSCFIIITAPEHGELIQSGGRHFPAARRILPRTIANLQPSAENEPKYGEWLAKHRTPLSELERQRTDHEIEGPTFSIIVPLYRTPIDLFEAMANSVLDQTYGKWELVLVNSTPDDAALSSAVSALATKDDRVKVVNLDGNYGITENTNRGIDAATGDYVSFFDHDDLLEPDMLYEYASAIKYDPAIDLLYCDEDKLLDDGTYFYPNFKPDFSIDQLRNNNYVCHMLTVRKSLLDKIGRTPAGFDGSQDHYLTLRVSEETSHIHHVPKVLYHWRATENSTAMNASNKTYATDAGIKAVQSNLDRLGIDGLVESYGRPFTYRVRYHAPKETKVAIIVPVENDDVMAAACVHSVLTCTDYGAYEIVVPHSQDLNDNTSEMLNSIAGLGQQTGSEQQVHLMPCDGNLGKSALVNVAASKSDANAIVIMDSNVTVDDPQWLSILLGYAMRSDVGAVSPRLFKSNCTYYHAGFALTPSGINRLFKDIHKDEPMRYFAYCDITRNVSALDDACLVTSKKVFEEVGGLDENLSFFMAGIDYCLKTSSTGYLCTYTADTTLWYESIDEPSDECDEENALIQKWPEFFEQDPFYNRNLCQTRPSSQYYVIGD